MGDKRRGVVLTTIAILFALLGLSNFLKPFHLLDNEGFVFLGVRQIGLSNAILGPAFGAFLWMYALGIWRMKRYALPMAQFYALYVIVNLALFTIHARAAGQHGSVFEAVIYTTLGVGVSSGAAIVLNLRKSELS
jgi:hypothetical protein